MDGFTKYSQDYYLLHKSEFENNDYIEEAIENGDLLNFEKLEKIPEDNTLLLVWKRPEK